MAFAGQQAVDAARSAGQHQDHELMKIGAGTPDAAGSWYSFYTDVGSPGAAANPTTYANLTSFAGSMAFDNVSPANRYLTGCALQATQNCTLMVYDRLGQIGAVNITTVAGDTINSSALPRSMSTNDLLNVEAWLEVTTAPDGDITLAMSAYTNQDGTGSRVGGSLTIPSGANVGYMAKFPFQAGDKAVKSLETIAVSVEAATVGVINVILMRPIAKIPIVANLATVINFRSFKRVYDGSSLFVAAMATAASPFNVWGTLEFTYDS